MEDNREIDELILMILIAHESPLTSEEICAMIINMELYEFDENSPVDEDNLETYISDYLVKMELSFPVCMFKLPDGQYLYTPYKDLPIYTAQSLHKVFFKDYENTTEILERKDDASNPDAEELISLSLLMIEGDVSDEMLNVFAAEAIDARIRYLSLITLLEGERDRVERDKLIERGLADPNKKINAASLHYIRPSSSDEVYNRLVEFLDDGDLYSIAYRAAYLANKKQVYQKHLEIAKSDDIDIAALSIKILLQPHRAVAMPYQIKMLEEWGDYMANCKELGYSYDSIISKVTESVKEYLVIPRDVKKELIEYCNSDSWLLQNVAMRGMESKWAIKDYNIISSITTHKNPIAKQLKLKAMVDKNARSSVDKAVEYLYDTNELVRDTAVEVLGDIGGKAELKRLVKIGIDDKYNPGKILEAINKIKERLQS